MVGLNFLYFSVVLTKYKSVLIVIDCNVKASCFAVPRKAPAVEAEMIPGTTRAGSGAVSAKLGQLWCIVSHNCSNRRPTVTLHRTV
jgi:hypothetical protein